MRSTNQQWCDTKGGATVNSVCGWTAPFENVQYQKLVWLFHLTPTNQFIYLSFLKVHFFNFLVLYTKTVRNNEHNHYKKKTLQFMRSTWLKSSSTDKRERGLVNWKKFLAATLCLSCETEYWKHQSIQYWYLWIFLLTLAESELTPGWLTAAALEQVHRPGASVVELLQSAGSERQAMRLHWAWRTAPSWGEPLSNGRVTWSRTGREWGQCDA